MRLNILSSRWSCVILLILTGFVNTCVHNSKPEIPIAEEIPAETIASPAMELIKEPLPIAVQSLLKKAQSALEQKQYAEAQAHAERAYRMEGRDFRVLFMMARVNLSLGSSADAEQWAGRALESLPNKYKAHRVQTWEFIAKVRKLRQDDIGEQAALKEARSIR